MKVRLERSVPMPAGPDATWAVLSVIETVAGCMPGAKLTLKIDAAPVLALLPHNRPASCDVPAMVRALTTGVAPLASSPRAGGGSSVGPTC